jgi:hypothetical protein
MEIMNNSPGAGEVSPLFLWGSNCVFVKWWRLRYLNLQSLEDILDVLSVRPEAQNDTYNPIPRCQHFLPM